MPNLVASPTELTTAATDAVLAVAALLAAAFLLRRKPSSDASFKVSIWVAAFSLLALGAAAGAFAHAFQLPEATLRWLWRLIFLALGWTVSLFAVGVVFDLGGPRAARQWLGPLLVLGLGFFLATEILEASFLFFVGYEAAAMLFALGSYLWLAVRRRPGALVLAAGILLSIAAAAIQATGALSFTLVWPFDPNGAFHLVQTLAMPLLAGGVARSLRLSASEV